MRIEARIESVFRSIGHGVRKAANAVVGCRQAEQDRRAALAAEILGTTPTVPRAVTNRAPSLSTRGKSAKPTEDASLLVSSGDSSILVDISSTSSEARSLSSGRSSVRVSVSDDSWSSEIVSTTSEETSASANLVVSKALQLSTVTQSLVLNNTVPPPSNIQAQSNRKPYQPAHRVIEPDENRLPGRFATKSAKLMFLLPPGMRKIVPRSDVAQFIREVASGTISSNRIEKYARKFEDTLYMPPEYLVNYLQGALAMWDGRPDNQQDRVLLRFPPPVRDCLQKMRLTSDDLNKLVAEILWNPSDKIDTSLWGTEIVARIKDYEQDGFTVAVYHAAARSVEAFMAKLG